jgi:carbamoyl-phosphate synthase large subunit
MAQLRVVVISAGTQVGQNVRATLASRHDGVALIATSSVANEPALFDFEAVHLVPPTAADPAAFEDALLRIMDRERADLVVPCRDDDVVFLGALRDRRPDLAPRLLCGNAATARILCDKWLSYEFCVEHDLPYAATIMRGTDAQREAFVRKHGFPLIAKPRGGWSSLEVYVVHRHEQLSRMLDRDGFVAQQFLGDTRRVADYLERLEANGLPLFHDFQGVKHSLQALIAPDGSVVQVFCMRRVRQMRRSKHVEHDPDPRSHEIALRCAQAFSAAGWRGPLNIQCGEAANGEIRIHEFSGRFTGATVDRWLLGLDEVGLAVEHFTGRRIETAHRAPPPALEAFESRVGRAADPRNVEKLTHDGVWRRG